MLPYGVFMLPYGVFMLPYGVFMLPYGVFRLPYGVFTLAYLVSLHWPIRGLHAVSLHDYNAFTPKMTNSKNKRTDGQHIMHDMPCFQAELNTNNNDTEQLSKGQILLPQK